MGAQNETSPAPTTSPPTSNPVKFSNGTTSAPSTSLPTGYLTDMDTLMPTGSPVEAAHQRPSQQHTAIIIIIICSCILASCGPAIWYLRRNERLKQIRLFEEVADEVLGVSRKGSPRGDLDLTFNATDDYRYHHL